MIGWLFLAVCVGTFLWIAATVAAGRRPRALPWLGAAALIALWAVTGVVLIARFSRGLGAVSGMSDRFPWGVWIGLDVLSGVAVAAGGYVIAASVHIFDIRRFEPILRPTVLNAFLGYGLVAVALLVDIGRPYRIWHPLVMWQHHSIMFEVAWCVTLYTTVLAVEFSPVVFERLGLGGALSVHRVFAIPVVILGVILSTLHQSSLGSLFLIVPQKLSPLWYSPLLPVFFLVSSVAVGMCVIIIESFFSSKVFGRSLELPLLSDLGRAGAFVLLLYLAVKTVDVIARDAWRHLFSEKSLGASFLVEMVVGVLLPAVLLARRSVRRHPLKLFACALLVVGGAVLNRLNVSWFGLLPYTGPVYFPTWMELAVSLSFGAVAVVAFGVAVRYLPVFSGESCSPAGTSSASAIAAARL